MADLTDKIISSNFQRLLQVTASGAVADGTGSQSQLTLDYPNNRVGVGTTNPTHTFNVVGTSNFSGSIYSGSNLIAMYVSGGIVPAGNAKYDLGGPFGAK